MLAVIALASSLLFNGSNESRVEPIDEIALDAPTPDPISIDQDEQSNVIVDSFEDTEDTTSDTPAPRNEVSLNPPEEIDLIYEDPAVQADLQLNSTWSDEQLAEALERAALAEEEYFNENEYADDLIFSDPVKYQELLQKADAAEQELFRDLPFDEQDNLRQRADEQESSIMLE